MSPQKEEHAINRILKAHGLPTLEHPDVLSHFGYLVEDHQHLTELLRVCKPELRREMYESMKPHLRFPANSLDWYESRAKEQAESHRLPLTDETGDLRGFPLPPVILMIEEKDHSEHVTCCKCGKGSLFIAQDEAAAIKLIRSSGWAWDESKFRRHICNECLDAICNAVHETPS